MRHTLEACLQHVPLWISNRTRSRTTHRGMQGIQLHAGAPPTLACRAFMARDRS